jgi:hypothetical protein
MMYRAFVEMRGLGFQGKSKQASALADAFHNLPLTMYQPNFDWAMSRRYFESYNSHYPPGSETRTPDYVAMHDRVQAAGAEDATE